MLLCIITALLWFCAVPRKVTVANSIAREKFSYTLINQTDVTLERVTIGKHHSGEVLKKSPLVTIEEVGPHSTNVGMVEKVKDLRNIYISALVNGKEMLLIDGVVNDWFYNPYRFTIVIESVNEDGTLNGKYLPYDRMMSTDYNFLNRERME